MKRYTMKQKENEIREFCLERLEEIADYKGFEDFSEMDASNVSDDIVENTEDTMTLLEKYIDELDVTLDKSRLKTTMKSLYTEAQDLEL